jgi:glycosyltransferase involved in cell wall biosynthesis
MMADNEKNIFRRFYLKNLAARLKRLETEAPHKFDAIIPISEPDYQWFRSVSAGKPVMLCETGVIMDEFIPDDAGGALKVGFIGALNWQPNIAGLKWFLAEVWPDITEARPEVTLHIAGRGATKMTIKQLKGKNVVFEGEVDDAARFTSMMPVMIAPLFAGSGLRIKIIEAMCHGKPVVATPAAAKGLAAADLRGIFICDDAGKFSDTLISLIDNPAMREAAGNAAKEVVMTRFDNRKLTATLYGFYKELIHGR